MGDDLYLGKTNGGLSMGAVVKGPWFDDSELARAVRQNLLKHHDQGDAQAPYSLEGLLISYKEARDAYWDSVAVTPWE